MRTLRNAVVSMGPRTVSTTGIVFLPDDAGISESDESLPARLSESVCHRSVGVAVAHHPQMTTGNLDAVGIVGDTRQPAHYSIGARENRGHPDLVRNSHVEGLGRRARATGREATEGGSLRIASVQHGLRGDDRPAAQRRHIKGIFES